MASGSSGNQDLNDEHDRNMGRLEWLKEMSKEPRLEVTVQQNSSAQEGEMSASDDNESLALYRYAKEEQQQGQLLKAIHTYVQVIRIQLKSRQLRRSSPSRKALRQICKILVQLLPEVWPVSFTVHGWWLTDTLAIDCTLEDSIMEMPSEIATVEVLQTLADYILKWYAPNSLNCAALLYERILSQLDGETSISHDKRRSYVVKELAKIYVEQLSNAWSRPETISAAQHAIIREGRLEIEKCSISERMQFYQHLGALYVQRAGKDPQCSGREGEEMLQRIYEMQKRLFGCADSQSVKTLDILSRYYAEQVGREAEAVQLLSGVLGADRITPQYEESDEEDEKELWELEESDNENNLQLLSQYYVKQGGSDTEIVQLIDDVLKADRQNSDYDDSDEEDLKNTQYEKMRRAIEESENARATRGDGGVEIAQLVADVLKTDRLSLRKEDSDEEDVEEAGDERKRREIEKCKDFLSLRDTRATDHKYSFWSPIMSNGLQGRLMSLLAPEHCVWEDSRLYLNNITSVRFQRVKITDALENYPVRITRLRTGEVDVQVPIIAHPLSANNEAMTEIVSEVIRSVRESNLYELLRSGATADQLARRPPMTTIEDQTDDTESDLSTSDDWDETSDVQPNRIGSGIQPDLISSEIDHVFWAFPRDLNSVAASDQVYVENEQKNSFIRKPRMRSPSYQFQKLSDRPEWMVVVKESMPKQTWRPGESRETYDRVWTWHWISSDNLVYSVNEGEGSSISVVCPYVAYEDLCQVTGFGWGFTYADFVQQLRSSRRTGNFPKLMKIKKAMCKEWSVDANKELPTVLIDEAHQTPQTGTSEDNSETYHQSGSVDSDETEGFFNNIPGRGVWIHHKSLVPGFNLVSSQWADWQTFVSDDSHLTMDYPELRTVNGDPIRCRGYISGSWIPGNLEGRYVMEKVFVVDAIFTTSREPRRQWEFVFSQSPAIGNSRAELTSLERRCLIASLNPLVFRFIGKAQTLPGAPWIKKKKKKLAREPTFEDGMMIELKRREKVISDYKEKRKQCQNDGAMIAKIEIEHNLELRRWEEWEQKQKSVIESMKQMAK